MTRKTIEGAFLPPKDAEDSPDDEGGAGASELLAQYIAEFNLDRRQRPDGQKKFGSGPHVPPRRRDSSALLLDSPPHPLLSWSQQFCGISPRLNPLLINNPEAQANSLQLRLEQQFQKKQKLGKARTVRLTK